MIVGTGDKTDFVFWMVYGEGQRAPTYKHDTADAAEAEAARLAREHPGVTFYTLKAKHAARVETPLVSAWSLKKRPPLPDDDDGFPF